MAPLIPKVPSQFRRHAPALAFEDLSKAAARQHRGLDDDDDDEMARIATADYENLMAKIARRRR